MDDYYKITVETLAVLSLLLLIVFLITIFQIKDENTKAEEDIDGHDLFIRGYEITRALSENTGIPEDWCHRNDTAAIGLVTDHEYDMQKIVCLINMSDERFRSFFQIEGLDYSFELEKNGSVVMSQYKEIPSEPVKVSMPLGKDMDLFMYLWRVS